MERDSLAFVADLWQSMTADFTVALIKPDRNEDLAQYKAGPHEIVTTYLQTARWTKWIAVLDGLSAVEMGMLLHIAEHNVEEIRERQKWVWYIASILGATAWALRDELEWLSIFSAKDLILLMSPVLIVALYLLTIRMKAGELQSCIRLASARRPEVMRSGGPIDAATLRAARPRSVPGSLRLLVVLLLAAAMLVIVIWVRLR